MRTPCDDLVYKFDMTRGSTEKVNVEFRMVINSHHNCQINVQIRGGHEDLQNLIITSCIVIKVSSSGTSKVYIPHITDSFVIFKYNFSGFVRIFESEIP